MPAAVPTPGNDPLLVLHGFPSSSFDWRHVLAALRRAPTTSSLFDFLGFGLVRASPTCATRSSCTRTRSMRLPPTSGSSAWCSLSHDMGNSVGGELLARRPRRRRSPSRSGAGCSRTAPSTSRWRSSPSGQQFLLALDDAPVDLGAERRRSSAAGVAATFSPTQRRRRRRARRPLGTHVSATTATGCWRARSATSRTAAGGRGTLARSSRHPSPLHVVWGRDDPVAVVRDDRTAARGSPDATLVTLDGVAALPMIEDPEGSRAARLGRSLSLRSSSARRAGRRR